MDAGTIACAINQASSDSLGKVFSWFKENVKGIYVLYQINQIRANKGDLEFRSI